MRGKTWRLVSIAVLAAALAVFAAGCGGRTRKPRHRRRRRPRSRPSRPRSRLLKPARPTPARPTRARPRQRGRVRGHDRDHRRPHGRRPRVGEDQLELGEVCRRQWNDEHGSTYELVERRRSARSGRRGHRCGRGRGRRLHPGRGRPGREPQEIAVGKISGRGHGVRSRDRRRATDVDRGSLPDLLPGVPSDADQGPTVATYMIDTIGAPTVMVIDDQSSYSPASPTRPRRRSRAPASRSSRESVGQERDDFSALVSAVPDDTDVVFMPWQIAANAQLFAEQMAEQGKRGHASARTALLRRLHDRRLLRLLVRAGHRGRCDAEDAAIVDAYTRMYGGVRHVRAAEL